MPGIVQAEATNLELLPVVLPCGGRGPSTWPCLAALPGTLAGSGIKSGAARSWNRCPQVPVLQAAVLPAVP